MKKTVVEQLTRTRYKTHEWHASNNNNLHRFLPAPSASSPVFAFSADLAASERVSTLTLQFLCSHCKHTHRFLLVSFCSMVLLIKYHMHQPDSHIVSVRFLRQMMKNTNAFDSKFFSTESPFPIKNDALFYFYKLQKFRGIEFIYFQCLQRCQFVHFGWCV